MNTFWKWLERKLEIKDDPLPDKADVIIAVGIDVNADGKSAGPYSAAVAQKALELYNNQKVNNLLFTGGYNFNNGLTEAQLMHGLVVRQIQDASRVFLETQANRTYLNADLTLPFLQDHVWKSAIIAAQQWHARRVRATFKKRWAGTGIKIYVIKAHSDYGGGSQSRLDHFISFFLWDTLAFIISKFKGYC